MTATQEQAPPEVVTDSISGLALAAAAANVVMQLARLPVGHGVANSTVDSGRIDKHPIKRARTTLSYIAVAMLGSDDERAAMRREVDRSHRHVNAREPVKYNAFDRDLQLWVAACLYMGTEDIYRILYGEPGEEQRETLYRYGARFGTTLQMTEDMWPADRAAFQKYWDASLAEIEMDDLTRGYLRDLTELKFLPAPFPQLFGAFNRFQTVGFLPQPFRDELGYRWTARDQARFDRLMRALGRVNRALPRPLREFPFNVYLWDVRRRIRGGLAIV
ncbi:oxygenase MpaB family protein [Actinomadura sediminis]|uniref:Oxygenase MpaB family protein n=1 Tax=Actinomadura sediminis TaxID=1038904 RepID=A0ABW3F3J3_9ACTN